MNTAVRSGATPPLAAIDRFLRDRLLRNLAALRGGEVALTDVLGTEVLGEAGHGPVIHLHVHDPGFYRAMARGGSVGAAEAFIEGQWDCSDLVGLVRLLVRNRDLLDGMEGGSARIGGWAMQAWHALRRNTREGARRNIATGVSDKLFDSIGRTLTIAVDEPLRYRIAGVFEDLPDNTDLQASILINLPKTPPAASAAYWFNWGSTSLRTYLRFATPDEAGAFREKLPAFVDRRGRENLGSKPSDLMGLSLLPFTRAHLEPEGQQSASRKLTVAALGIVGLLTLLIAIVNYVNLATARAGLRAREVAMRKVLGADRAALVRQFLAEAVLTVFVAALLGLILAELGLPLVNAAGGLSLSLPYALVVPGLVVLGERHGLPPLPAMQVVVLRSKASRGVPAVDALEQQVLQTLRRPG